MALQALDIEDRQSSKITPDIPDHEMPRYIRRCYDRYMTATTKQREVETESLGFYVGGDRQWRDAEIAARKADNRSVATINRCRPAVDQVTNEARQNPPGPKADPVGGMADSDAADILEGMIREYEYRSNANLSRINALTYACAGGRGVYEMATEYADDRSLEQQIVIKYADDPSSYFYDPDSRLPGHQDARWGGRIRKFSREGLMSEYPGRNLKVLNRSTIDQIASAAGSWIKDAFGWESDLASANTWTGANSSQGPFYVCEFYIVKTELKKLYLYDDHVLRFEDEKPSNGAKRMIGSDVSRTVPIPTVWKYVVTAFDVIERTEWYGTIIPYFWIMGPEMWVDGKLYRLSLIEGAKDSQRMLNYTATSIAEITGTMTKAPFIGYEGVFDVTNAQGISPWQTTNKQWAYLEAKVEFATAPDGTHQLLPLPQRNTWEAPIARLMECGNWFVEMIKGATSVFFEPSLPSAQAIQSGAAIRELQQQTNVGTANWQEALQNAVQLEYWQASIIIPKISDGTRVRNIVRPDTSHEMVEINKEFPAHEMDHATGKHRTVGPDGKERLESTNNIALGKFSLRVKAGPNEPTRAKDAITKLLDLVKMAPATVQQPASLAALVRLIGEGNPDIESFADGIAPQADSDLSPQAQQAQMMQLQQQNKLLVAAIQKLQQETQAKLPQIEADKWKALLDAVTKINVAEISASKDSDHQKADILASQAETMLNLAHDSAAQVVQNQQEMALALMSQQNQQAQTPEAQQPTA